MKIFYKSQVNMTTIIQVIGKLVDLLINKILDILDFHMIPCLDLRKVLQLKTLHKVTTTKNTFKITNES